MQQGNSRLSASSITIKTLAMSTPELNKNGTQHHDLENSKELSVHLQLMACSYPHNTISLARNAVFMLFLLAATGYVFAIDGNFNIGGKNRKSTLATVKKDLKLTLGSGYTFHQNRNIPAPKAQKGVFNNVISYQKGNITYYMPYKSKPILGKFKTPTPPQVR